MAGREGVSMKVSVEGDRAGLLNGADAALRAPTVRPSDQSRSTSEPVTALSALGLAPAFSSAYLSRLWEGGLPTGPANRQEGYSE